MNNKITFPRLASMLADESGRSKRFSEDFLREFFSLISERLVEGDSVKIKGLGTFRLSRVEPRKSVDVTTGQPMEISGHSKVVFIPAKELADAVNAPFEAFSTVEIGDDIDLSRLQTEEELELHTETNDSEISLETIVRESAEDLTTAPQKQPKEEEKTIAASSTVTPVIEFEEAIIEGVADEAEKPSDKIEDSDKEIDYSEDEVISNEEADNQEEEQINYDMHDSTEIADIDSEAIKIAEEDATPEDAEGATRQVELQENKFENRQQVHDRRRWTNGFLWGMLASIAVVAVVFGIAMYFMSDSKSGESGIFSKGTTAELTENKASQPKTDASQAEEAKVATSAETATPPTSEIGEEVPTAPSDPLVYDTISTTRYLTTMAKSHYGNYNLWPIIYEENKAQLGHPDRIRPGTPVVVPPLSKYGIDPKNRNDVEKIKNMGIEIYARYGKKI